MMSNAGCVAPTTLLRQDVVARTIRTGATGAILRDGQVQVEVVDGSPRVRRVGLASNHPLFNG